jgi:hypothetical protein
MNYEHRHERTPAYASERRDCTVRATSTVMGLPYGDVYKRIAAIGRKKNKGIPYPRVAREFDLKMRPELSCHHLSTILPDMQKGRFVVRVSRHVFAVVDGVVIDG